MKTLLILLLLLVAAYFHVTQRQRLQTLESELSAAHEKTAELQQAVDKLRAAPEPQPASAPATRLRPAELPSSSPSPASNKTWMWEKKPMDGSGKAKP